MLVTHSCPTLCSPVDCSPPSSSVSGVLQAKILERVAFPSSGDLPYPGKMWIEPRSPALQVDSLPAESQGKPKIEFKMAENLPLYAFFTPSEINVIIR